MEIKSERKLLKLYLGLLSCIYISSCANQNIQRESNQKLVTKPASCTLNVVQMERLIEFENIQGYLRTNVFPMWNPIWPKLFLYDEKCQYILNHTGAVPVGFLKNPELFGLNGFQTKEIFSRSNKLTMPVGISMSFTIPAQAFTYSNSTNEKWFVMGLYEVWKRDFKDSLEFYFGMLTHEMFHTYQFNNSKLKLFMERSSPHTLTNFYDTHSEFARSVDLEKKFLLSAIRENAITRKMHFIRKFLASRNERRNKQLSNHEINFIETEPISETIEGTAEYMNFRVMTDAKNFKFNRVLAKVDSAYSGFEKYKRITLDDALSLVKDRPSYIQTIGVLTIILLIQTHPKWEMEIFENGKTGEQMLREISKNEI